MMMMGNHGRPPFRRTTSMTGITVNLGNMDAAAPPPPPPPPGVQRTTMIGGEYEYVETADFLRSCGLCNRRLAPGRDIYMYRGDAAFCSQECREHQMKQDERKERLEAAAAKNGENHRSEVAAAARKSAGKNGTMAAA